MSFNVGRAIKKDPTRTKTRRMAFERDLVRLYRNFKKSVIPRIKELISQEQASTILSRQKQTLSIQDDAERIIDEEIEKNITHKAKDVVEKHTTLAYRAGAERASKELAGYGLVVPPDLTFFDMEVLNDLFTRNLNLVKGVNSAVKNDMLRIIGQGLLEGQHPYKIARNISKSIDKIGVKRARLIARTETIRSYNTAVSTKYKRSGIKKWRWLTAFDERTCPECASRDGRVYEWGDEQPPLHPRCRCSILAVVEE